MCQVTETAVPVEPQLLHWSCSVTKSNQTMWFYGQLHTASEGSNFLNVLLDVLSGLVWSGLQSVKQQTQQD